MARKFKNIIPFIIISLPFVSTGCSNYSCKLAAPTIELNDHFVSWDEVEKANGYSVYINNRQINVYSNRFDLSDYENIGTYNIQVAAFNDNDSSILCSELSNALTYEVTRDVTFHYEYDTGDKKLVTPVVGLDGHIFYWDIIHYATGYRIYFNGEAHDEVTENFYVMDRTIVGEYNVTVKAFSEDERYGASDESNSVSIKVNQAFNPITVYADDFGATGKGIENDRPYIQKAIDYVYEYGGGTVVLSKNKTYYTGGLFLKDNVSLKFEDNAMVKQSSNDDDYVIASKDGSYLKTKTFKGTNIDDVVQFNHCWLYNYPLIGCLMGTKNISVTGNGVIKMMDYEDESTVIRALGCGFGNSKYIKAEGFTVRNYNGYACGAYDCEYVLFKGITIKDFFGGCNDGISALNSSKMRITGNYIRSGDDSIDVGCFGEGNRLGVWSQKDPSAVKNIEVDHNDTDASGCKGLALFAWGGLLREGKTEAESRKLSVTEDIWVHDNKFATMGYWNSQSHDSVYGGIGIMPIKDLRFYDNEVGNAYNGFFYEGTSNINAYKSMATLMDGDFEYSLGAFWSTRGTVNFPKLNNNTYAEMKENSEMFEGISLMEHETYVFSMDIQTSGQPITMFVRDVETETILNETNVSKTQCENVKFSFTPETSGNYQVGFKTGESSACIIDNVKLEKSYSEQLYYDAGSDYRTVANVGDYGEWIQGYNFISLESDNLKAGDEVKVIYFLTINSITDPNGYISFSPLLQSGTDTIGESTFTTKNSDLAVKNGKVMLSYTMKLPKSYKTGQSISCRLRAYSGIDFTFHRLIIVKPSLTLSTFAYYSTAIDTEVDVGSFANIAGDIYLFNKTNRTFASEIGEWSGWFEGERISGDESIKPGDRIKVTYCFDITEIKDSAASLNFNMFTWINRDATSPASSQTSFTLSSLGMKTGKIYFSFTGKMPESKKVDEEIYPMLSFSSGVCGTLDKIIIADENADLTSYTNGFEGLFNKDLIGGHFSTVDGIYLDAAGNGAWTSGKGVESGWKEGPRVSNNQAIVEDKLIKITYLFNISEISDANSTASLVCKTWKDGTSIELYTLNDISYSKLCLKTGKVAISYVAKVNENHNVDELIYPMFKFNSGVSGTWDRVLITDADTDLSQVFSDYEFLDTQYLFGGPFSTVDSVYINASVNGAWTSAKGVESGWKEGVHVSDNTEITEGKLIKITYLFNISQIADADSSINLVCKTWKEGTSIELYTQNTVSYSDIGLKTGKIAISYVAKVNENHNVDEWIYPMLKFNSGVSGTWDRVLITDAETDLSQVFSDYEFLDTQYLTGGPFGTESI